MLGTTNFIVLCVSVLHFFVLGTRYLPPPHYSMVVVLSTGWLFFSELDGRCPQYLMVVVLITQWLLSSLLDGYCAQYLMVVVLIT